MVNKELKDKADALINGLAEYGVVDFFFSFGDPDNDNVYVRDGRSKRWTYGACKEYCIEVEEEWRLNITNE